MSNQPMSTRDKMEQAKQLIQQKRYDEARTILRTVDHDKAYEWLDKLDEVDPPKAAKRGNKRKTSCLIALMLLIVSLGIAVFVLGRTFSQSVEAILSQALQATATGTIPPVPLVLSKAETDYVIAKCIKEIYKNSGMYTNFNQSIRASSKEDGFHRLGSTAKIYMGDYCTVYDAFQVVWVAYLEVREQSLSPVLDKNIAWSRYLVGWASVEQMYAEETATMQAYRASIPTEAKAPSPDVFVPTSTP